MFTRALESLPRLGEDRHASMGSYWVHRLSEVAELDDLEGVTVLLETRELF